MRKMKRYGFRTLAVALCLMCTAGLLLTGGQTSGEDSWRQLSLGGFVQEIERTIAGEAAVSEQVWAEIRTQSAERLRAAVENGTQADYADLVSLYLWAKPTLTAEQTESVLARLTPQSNQTSSWTFAKLQSVCDRMVESEMPVSSTDALPLSWLEGRDVRTLDDADQLAWLFERVHTIGRREKAATEFTVQWTGAVQAPNGGQYTFSLCPLPLDVKAGSRYRKQTTKMWVGGRQIFDSSSDPESLESAPVTLTSGQRAAIGIELTYACSDGFMFAANPAVAALSWETAGMSRRLMPQNALWTEDGTQNGLNGHYVLELGEQDRSFGRVDSQIDFVWYHGSLIDPAEGPLRKSLADQLFRVVTDAGTLAGWESEKGAAREDWPGANWGLLESLGTQQQQTWAETLIAHPVLLEDCTRASAARLYRGCRVGSPAGALELFGCWAQAHGQEQAALSVDFYADNRQAYRKMAGRMAWESDDHLAQLEQDYLDLPDGGCALPIAYTLCYGYWAQRQMGQWIEKLDGELAAEQNSGDRRVSWLLARAQAEEMRLSRPGRFCRTMERSLAGEGWIQEAALVADVRPFNAECGRDWLYQARKHVNSSLIISRRKGTRTMRLQCVFIVNSINAMLPCCPIAPQWVDADVANLT